MLPSMQNVFNLVCLCWLKIILQCKTDVTVLFFYSPVIREAEGLDTLLFSCWAPGFENPVVVPEVYMHRGFMPFPLPCGGHLQQRREKLQLHNVWKVLKLRGMAKVKLQHSRGKRKLNQICSDKNIYSNKKLKLALFPKINSDEVKGLESPILFHTEIILCWEISLTLKITKWQSENKNKNKKIVVLHDLSEREKNET